MPDRDPKPRNPLGPYYPSEVPSIPGDGRPWLGFLVLALLALWVAATLLELLGVLGL